MNVELSFIQMLCTFSGVEIVVLETEVLHCTRQCFTGGNFQAKTKLTF